MANPFPSLEMTERSSGRRARERLSTNENEFGPAPEVLRAIGEAASEAHRYPDCDHFVLRQRLADELRTEPDHVRIGSGVDGLLGESVRAFLGPGRTAVTSAVTYPTFAYLARSRGTAVHPVPLRSGALDPDELARTAHETRADVIYVADPDNPTGRSQGAQAVLNLADALPLATLLIVDGAYAEYQDPCHRLTAKEVGGRRMLWLRSFSKAYALAGLRIGYAVGDPDLLAALDDGAEHYVVGRVAESAALAALDATTHLDRVLAQTAEGRAHYTAELGALGLTVLPGRTNFVTARTAAPKTAEHLADVLAQAGIFIRRLTAPGMTDCVRISIGPASQRATVLEAVAHHLARRPVVPTI
ncbi:pyridoxal phosphate-dependent aminotransferase [Streptomyces sp. NRRL WC-3618]|uniref:pyridoxal phosphate-dependent aminotransferase n=1 Tax=Streptomyces sp. NRRL WC-3618 TaxID=1519490 RepID=UPI0006B03FA4|nr:aminotransferase class I/II-fold pyridoxal phosphate-dependent enzyme [Streptomyces sp. NRRL WC-3618]